MKHAHTNATQLHLRARCKKGIKATAHTHTFTHSLASTYTHTHTLIHSQHHPFTAPSKHSTIHSQHSTHYGASELQVILWDTASFAVPLNEQPARRRVAGVHDNDLVLPHRELVGALALVCLLHARRNAVVAVIHNKRNNNRRAAGS